MKERPILFSAPMVQALLAGKKTQTRRGPRGGMWRHQEPRAGHPLIFRDGNWAREDAASCHYGKPGERLWVREAWRADAAFDALPPREIPPGPYFCEASRNIWDGGPHDGTPGRLRPGIFMPRWASRLTLEITGIRLEPVQSISAKDIIAEGAVERPHTDQFGRNPVSRFDGKVYLDLQSLWAAGWEKINGHGSWSANTWVWVVEFQRVVAKPSNV